MRRTRRWLGAAGAALWVAASGAFAQGTPPPIRIGSTLALTGPLAASPKPPKTIAVVTSKFPSVHFMSLEAREGRMIAEGTPAMLSDNPELRRAYLGIGL